MSLIYTFQSYSINLSPSLTNDMNTKIAIVCLAALLATATAKTIAKQLELPKARVSAIAVDEQGSPMSGVTVKFVFGEPTNANALVKVEGLTGIDGIFTGEGYSDGGYGADITKTNFYSSSLGAPDLVDAVNGRWQPWNPMVKVVMRKIEKPVPVYARTFRKLSIPEIQKPCGFDLEAGDWVAPNGKGRVADFIVTAQREYENRDKFNMSAVISFSNPLDGIQEVKLPEEWRYSDFKWPRIAPETGYQSTLSARFGTEPGKGFFDTASENQAYFFRVRTVEQNGKLVSALYGKIKGGIGLEGRETKTCSMAFSYYLNPTPLDRNMEFDLKRNLFTNLLNLEQPRLP
jgi:hypothetical protein